MKKSLLFTAISLAITSAHSIAEENASQSADSDETETITVTGSYYRTTGTKSGLLPMDAPMSYEIYNADLLNLRQVDSVNDALRYVPGVTPENRATVTIFDQYTIRGFESIRNFYDGLLLQYNNLWNLAPQVDVFATESVEILKGPTSVLYGSAPPGGMVNQVAKQPFNGEQTQLRMRAGSFDLTEVAVDHNSAIDDSLQYRLTGLYRKRDGQMETTREERQLFAPTVKWQLSDTTTIQFNLYYQDDPDMIPSTPLPGEGTVLESDFGELDSEAYAGDANWNSLEREVLMAGYKINHKFSDNLSFLQNFRYTNADLLQRNTYHFAPAGQILVRSAYRTDEDIEGYVVDNQLAATIELGEVEHNLLFGFDYQTLSSDIRYQDTFATGTPTIDLAQPDYHQFNREEIEANFVYVQTNDIEQKQSGFYIQDEINYGALTVLLNLRHDSFDSTDNADLGGTADQTTIDQNETTGRIAGIYKFDNGWAPYLSYAESFEPTSGVDSLTGEVFKPTTAEQVEAGVKYTGADGVLLTAAWFDIAQQNVVVNTPDFLRFTQQGEVTSTGIELSLTLPVSDSIELLTTYTYQDVEVSENPQNTALEGKSPVWVADQLANIWGTYNVSEDLSLSAGVRYVGESQIDALNTDVVPGYTLLDFAGRYLVNENVEVALLVSNLTDKRYVGACFDRNNCWMGAAQNAELSVNILF